MTVRSLSFAKAADVPRPSPIEDVPAISNAHWLVLALVIEKPSYGYEIGERYDRRFGSFLPVARTAIYSALDRLDQVGLIEALPLTPGRSAGVRRVRITYGPTPEAKRVHARWLESPVGSDRWRQELLTRIGTAHLQGATMIRELLGRYAQHAEMYDQRIQELLADRAAAGARDMRALTASLLLREQQAVVAAQLDWVRSACGAMSRAADRS